MGSHSSAVGLETNRDAVTWVWVCLGCFAWHRGGRGKGTNYRQLHGVTTTREQVSGGHTSSLNLCKILNSDNIRPISGFARINFMQIENESIGQIILDRPPFLAEAYLPLSCNLWSNQRHRSLGLKTKRRVSCCLV